jgi:[ribosomal protein S18]-alanine N-acetyltransferase
MSQGSEATTLRDATAADLPSLLRLEAGFPGDRLSHRQLRHHVGNAGACLRVAEDATGQVVGYALLLRRRGALAARLYSLVVDAPMRGRGVAGRLLADAEAAAGALGAVELRLEVRFDNAPALTLYRRGGYVETGRRPSYYEDGADAVCLRKRLGVTYET